VNGLRNALFRTLPGRAIVIGLAVKSIVFVLQGLAGALPPFVGVVDTVASIALAVGGGVFLVRGVALAQRRLLWRVRRKLIISYIFIGFIPALLLVAFALLGALLLFSNFSSYLVQARLRAIADRAESIAKTTALEIQRAGSRDMEGIVAQREMSASREFEGASIAVVEMRRACGELPPRRAGAAGEQRPPSAPPLVVAGPWAHVDAPGDVPDWIGCDGFKGLLAMSSEQPATTTAAATTTSPRISVNGQEVSLDDQSATTYMLIRALGFPDVRNPKYAVVVDLPVSGQVRQQFRGETGVELTRVVAVPASDGSVRPLTARSDYTPPVVPVATAALPLPSFIVFEYRDWLTGMTSPLVASMQISVAEIYDRISAAQGVINQRSFGQGLFLVLMLIGILFLIIEFVALVAGLALARSITGSVHELFAGTERVRQGDFTHKISISAKDQMGELAESFNSMTASIEDLLRQAAEKKRLEEELRIAHEIQMSLLPQGPLRMPGLSVTALCVPAREVGGDYYDFLPLDAHRVGVLIADVSGKGTSAALYMAELKGLILSLSRIHTSPRDLLITANRIIAEHLDARSFITMTYAVVDLLAGTMTYARAGHTPLIYLPGAAQGPQRVRILAPDGMVLGLKLDNGEMFERLLVEQTIPLRTGDLYLFFTDGISEAMNVGDDCFGEQRLATLVEEHAHLPADELRERVLREIKAFVGDAPQHDDMTMILLKVDAAYASDDAEEAKDAEGAKDAEVAEVHG
jgi:sigma-B regulation protein RsbU (phosphoserine phosphatase)